MAKRCSCGALNGDSTYYCVACGKDMRKVATQDEVIPSFEPSVPYYRDYSGEVTIGTWILVFILQAIPFVNLIGLICLAIWGEKESLKNYAKAALIVMLVTFVLLFLLSACSF